MSEWPETLVSRVLVAIETAWLESEVEEVDFRLSAIAALDALGLREETGTSWNPRDIESRFVTPWEDV